MSSELEVLKQRIVELEAKNAELEAEKAELLKRLWRRILDAMLELRNSGRADV
ncbi:hypothetical protein RhiirA5_367925 [Rhizophagus irregularis]|uniref:Uncharacterized protein n=1 Tax=Rhizophagus irregularis TaxID=588596 RepID=A0A2N0NMV5_9GLOM|nr:hypothetical protein RhiirA5_367925 [Rhizophagus irregularis]